MSGEPQPPNPQALAFLSVILAGDLLLPSRLPIPKLKASGKQRAPTVTFPFEKSRNDQPPRLPGLRLILVCLDHTKLPGAFQVST